MNNLIKIFGITIVMIFIFNGCVRQSEKIIQTKSGLPQVEINTTDVELIKSTIMDKIYSSGKGYTLINETNNLLVFQKEPSGFAADLAQVLLVGANGEKPKVEVKFTISKRKNNVAVYAHLFQVYKNGLGKVDKIDSTRNNQNFNDLYTFLLSVKNNIE